MRKNYALLFTILLSGICAQAQIRPPKHGSNSSGTVLLEKIKKDSQFFKGDTLTGFPLEATIHEGLAKYSMYTELLPYIRQQEISYVKKKYKISKLPDEFNIESYRAQIPSVLAGPCNNVDFESGNFANWTGGIGYNPNTNGPLTVTGGAISTLGVNSPETSCSFHTIVSAGADPYGLFPMVDPGGGSFACRLGGELLNLECDYYNAGSPNYAFGAPNITSCVSNDPGVGVTSSFSNGETMQQTFPVTAANCLFTYNYAVVISDAPHTGKENPYFSVQVFDQGGALIPCLSYFVEADTTGAGGVPPGFFVSASMDQLGNSVLYTPWTLSSLNLKPYIGSNVTVKFTAAGCTQGGHFAYAYVDCSCGPLVLIIPGVEVCLGGTEALSAPPAAGGTYAWSGPGIVGSTTSQTITTNQTGTYSVTITNSKGCAYVLDTNIAFYPIPVVSVNSATACPTNTVVLNATSTGGAGALTYNWSPPGGLSVTNDSTTIATVNATSSYTVTATSIHNCTNTAVANITVPVAPPPTFSAPPVCIGAATIINNTTGGAGTFSWNFGDGSAMVANQNSPTHTYTTTGNFVVTCTVNAGGCTNTNTNTVTINPNPTVTVTSPTMCAGAGPVTTTASGATTYTWNTGVTGANLTVNPAITTNYTVTGATAAGCTVIATTSVTVITNPIVTATSSSVCAGVTATLSASGVTTFTWTGPNLVATNGGTVTANPTTTSTYTVDGSIGTCTATTVATVTVVPNPTVTAVGSAICVGDTGNLSANNATTYTWTGPNLITNTGANVTANPGVTTTYSVIGTSNTCTATAVATLTVNPNPVVTVVTGSMCVGASPVVVTASGANTYTWNTGATGVNLTVNPAATTNYTVTGSTAAGCTNVATTSVIVVPNPTITATGSIICPTFTANLSANGATTFTWTGSNLVSTIGQSVTSNPTATSTYTVIGTANTCTATAVTTVTVLPTPTVAVVSPPSVCPGDLIAAPTFTNNPNDPATTYTWTNNNPNIGLATIGYSVPPAFTTLVNNTYANMTAVITVTPTLNGCVGPPATYTIIIKPTPFVNHIPNVQYCPNKNTLGVNFSAIPAGPTTFAWINTNNAIGLVSSGAGNIPTFLTVNTSSTFTTSAVHVVPTLNGCIGPDSSYVITINPLPNPGFTYSRACIGEATHFTDESTIGSGTIIYWGWDFTNGAAFTDATNPNPQTTLTPAGPHQIGLAVTSNKGCKNQIYETVNVNPLPVPVFVGDNLAGCPVHPVNFIENSFVPQPSPQHIISWSWDFGNGQTSSAQYPTVVLYNNGSPLTPYFYNVTLTVKTDSGCIATLLKPNYIEVYPKPRAGFTWGPSDVDILDPSVQFYNTSIGGSGNLPLHYYLGDVFIDHFDTANWSNLNNPRHTYTDQPYTYYVTQWVKNIYGCKDSITEPVIINPVYTFYIPNAFSPNGDGKNEGFKGTGIGIDNSTYNLWVFDRWGNQIFHTNDLEQTWNGTVNEVFVQEDVYVWKVRFSDMGGTKHEYHGHVSIVK